MLNLQLTVHLPTDFSGDGATLIVADLLAFAVPLHFRLGCSVAADLERDVVVVLDGLLLQRLGEYGLAGCSNLSSLL